MGAKNSFVNISENQILCFLHNIINHVVSGENIHFVAKILSSMDIWYYGNGMYKLKLCFWRVCKCVTLLVYGKINFFIVFKQQVCEFFSGGHKTYPFKLNTWHSLIPLIFKNRCKLCTCLSRENFEKHWLILQIY